jgi:hypothetical protein
LGDAVSKHSHTALKGAARELAEEEGLTYAEARRIIERWAAHEGPSDDELQAADATEFDPVYYHARTTSEIPGYLMRMTDYPEHSPSGPAPYCYPHTVPSLANPEQKAVLSLTARAAIYGQEAALIVEPLTYTAPAARLPGYGYWGNCWSVELHDQGFRYNRVSNLATPSWSATVTRGPEPSAPCTLRLANEGGYVLFDGGSPLPPDWLARVRVHPEGVPVFCGPCAGAPVPAWLEDSEADELLETADLIVARIPFTVTGAA